MRTEPGRAARRLAQQNYSTAKINRFPAWADRESIRRVYLECPAGLVVDHVIPLRGRLVSGLHVAANLQYLSKSDNSKKRNTFEIVSPGEP
jgi:hypothetical protein